MAALWYLVDVYFLRTAWGRRRGLGGWEERGEVGKRGWLDGGGGEESECGYRGEIDEREWSGKDEKGRKDEIRRERLRAGAGSGRWEVGEGGGKTGGWGGGLTGWGV
jgi:hypothetical protein